MCGIAGFYHPHKNYTSQEAHYKDILASMARVQRRRGPDDSGVWLSPHAGLAHVRLSIIDLIGGRQPMVKSPGGRTAAIAYNGELYNTEELRKELLSLGHTFLTSSDTEVILESYLEYGPDFAERLNGIFAIAIADTANNRLCLVRDRAGVKPLFYTVRGEELFFASEPKGLFAVPEIVPQADKEGLNEIFSLGPARTPGCGVFRNVREVLPGHMLLLSPEGPRQEAFWKLESRPHTDSFERTVEKTAFLVRDAVQRQMVSDVPICTFLSGGLDSSLVSSICAGELKQRGKILDTYAFDFAGNAENFTANSFQPSQDRPYADEMAEYLGTRHHHLECTSAVQANCLADSVLAHDLPAMADVDSSLLHFCSLVAKDHKVALTGECADEIFGGYPWFHREECFTARTFPWSMDLSPRKFLLKKEFAEYLDMDSYVNAAYARSLAQTPRLPEDTPEEARRREISWLNLTWFMQTLLNRMDRTSMYSGLEARVPFADHRIIEYLWNVPWKMKARGGVEKELLRQSARGLLPEDVLRRKKSPYPKTYDRNYERILAKKIEERLEGGSPVMEFIDKKKLRQFLTSVKDYGKPWYGQLMAGPQILAYLLQIDFWLEHYGVQVITA